MVMNIIWDENKNRKLKLERGISYEVFADLIINKKYLDILDNNSRQEQMIFIVLYKTILMLCLL